MIAQLQSELRKLRTTRTPALVLAAAVALTLLGVLIEGLSATLKELARAERQHNLLGAGSAAVFFATLAGLLVVTSEFRYGTIRPTLIFEPRRHIVLAAKLTAAGLAGVMFAVICVTLSIGAGLAVLSARGVDLALTGTDTLALASGTVAASAFGAMLGVAVGTLIRNQVGSIVAVVAYAFVVDALLFAAMPGAGRYLPGKAGDALAGRSVEHLLSPGLGAAVLASWTLALVAVAAVRNARSDT